MDTNTIEKFLLDRELEVISKKLHEIGRQIINVFSKYGRIEGDHAQELHDYIVEHVTGAGTEYYAGCTTQPRTNSHPSRIS